MVERSADAEMIPPPAAPELAQLPPETSAYADPSHSIGYLLRIAFRAFSRTLEGRTMTHGVSSGQWRFLRQLLVEGGLTQRELSRRVGMREPTTVVAVNNLERAGLVRRVPSETDRRKVHVHLTRKARALEAKLLPLVAEVHALATNGLDEEEIRVLRKALNRIIENLENELDADASVTEDLIP